MIPSKVFYFIRHGRTDANAQGLSCGGDWDIPLNSDGIQQAETASQRLLQLQPPVEKIFSSPMLRTQKTAALLNSQSHLEIETVEALREWCVGKWETKPWGDVPNPFNTTEDPPGGESRQVFEARIENVIGKILNDFSGIPLIVSHGAFAHSLFTILGVDRTQIENCVFYKIEPKELRWTLTRLSP